jgi:hypothetical protein
MVKCSECNRDFANQEDLDQHTKIYWYAETHDLDGAEKTISYLLHCSEIDKKNYGELQKHYDDLERKFYKLLNKGGV